MTTATTVGAVLCAAHRDMLGNLHGHTWTIWARFPNAGAPRDARVLQHTLDKALSAWDHGELPPELARGEDLAAAIGEKLLRGVDYVRVERQAERLIAEWWA
jgi:hypothetical protein